MEILDLTDAQQRALPDAYDIAKEVLRDLGIFPAEGQRRAGTRWPLELDEFERGYPRLTLSLLLDVVGAVTITPTSRPRRAAARRRTSDDDEPCALPSALQASADAGGRKALRTRIHATNMPGNAISWRALHRPAGAAEPAEGLRPTKRDGVQPLNYKELLRPGRVSVLDLSDSGMSELNNLVIADLLRGVQDAQDDAYPAYEKAKAKDPTPPPPRACWSSSRRPTSS